MNIVAVIPARYQSSRFPGKPLADICGKPMIWWVYQQVRNTRDINEVYVATDDERIVATCSQLNIPTVMTNPNHPTGTDRVAEVARIIDADYYLNVQGDEPLIESDTIKQAITPFFTDKSLQVSNLMTKIKDPIDVVNATIPKVIANENNIGLYLTRSPAPYPKGSLDYCYYKQVCVYGFTKEALNFFAETPRGRLEKIEDIEILRFIENGYKVKFVEVNSRTIAVDTEKDLNKVIAYVTENKIKKIE